MHTQKLVLAIVAALGLLITAGAQADMIGTYVGADAANTSGAVNDPWITPTGNGTDGLWYDRSSNGSAGDVDEVYEGILTENNKLTTTFTIAAAGQYDIYAVYTWHPLSSSDWSIAAGLSGADLTSHDNLYDDGENYNAGIDSGLSYVTDTEIRQAKLGTVTVSAGGSVSIDVDTANLMDPAVTGSRTWYHGASYALVPEPSTIALLGMGVLGLLIVAVRRRK